MKKSFLFCLWLLAAGFVYAQIPQQPKALPSPNAWAMAQVSKVPVSYYTGLPMVKIPLSELTYKGADLGICLNYNASGFRPDMHASSVGSGFNMSHMWAVNRKVEGLPDEYSITLTAT